MPTRAAAVLLTTAAVLLGGASGASADVRTITLRSPAFTLGGFQTRLPKIRVPAPARDGWVTAMNVRLVHPNGRQVSIRRVMLHHVVFINNGRSRGEYAGSCEGRFGEPIYGTGEERERLILPRGYGYRVRAGDRWRMQAMLMSHSLLTQRVIVRYTMRFVTGRTLQRVRPYWIRANGCEGKYPSYPILGGQGAGSTSTKIWNWRVPIDGRIVAAGGHLHAGARDMYLTDPACGGRRLLDTRPVFAPANDLVYRLRPILHEPGPVATRYFLSRQGMPVRRGQVLQLHGDYDGQWPRTGVMSIMHVYVAPGRPVSAPCPPMPTDAREILLRHDGRSDPPYVRVPLNTLGDDGHVREIVSLPGPTTVTQGPAEVAIRDGRFVPAKVSVPVGATLTWRYLDPVAHNAYFANGPTVVGSPTLTGGAVHRVTLTRPGQYQLFCYLHPVTMQQEITVRPAGT